MVKSLRLKRRVLRVRVPPGAPIKGIKMRQCLLEKGTMSQIVWLDVEKKDKGRLVDLKEGGDNWSIVEVYNPEFSKKWINARSQDHKNMKKRTDI